MSTDTAIQLTYVVGGLAAGITLLWVFTRRRTAEPVTVWDFEAEEWIELPPGVQPGSRQMTAWDLAEADELELLYLARAYDRAAAAIDEGMTQLFEELGPPPAFDPAWEAGRERLWDAVRDNQNQHKGDQP